MTNGERDLFMHIKEHIKVIFDVGCRADSEMTAYEGECHYFDPVKKFIDELLKKLNKSNQNKYKYIYNQKEVQKKDGQCGMFSICFIINYLKFNDFNKVINNNMTDKKMIELRKKFFIN